MRGPLMLGLVALSLVRVECLAAGHLQAHAAAPSSAHAGKSRASHGATRMRAMNLSLPLTLPAGAGTEFRPRTRSLTSAGPDVSEELGPALHSTTAWQRMRDFRANDRVRLLTLWKSTGSTFSLQANRKGEASLQWTSNSMNRGGATRGLFDRAFSREPATSALGPRIAAPGTAAPGVAAALRSADKLKAFDSAK